MNEITQYINLASGEILPFSVTKNDEYINVDYNIDDIIDIIDSSVIASHFRIYVLFPDETINYEIPNSDIQLGGSYSENYQNGARRSLSFTLCNDDGKYTSNINKLWIGTRLKLEQGIETKDNKIIWFHKGIFIISSSSPVVNNQEKLVTITAQDKFSLFEDKSGVLDSTYEIPVGSNIKDIIYSILLHSNGDNNCFDIKPIIYHESFENECTKVTISKSAGDTYASILLELAMQLSAEIFYNAMGNLTIIPLDEVIIDNDKPSIFNFDVNNGDLNHLNFDFNLNEIVNRIVVIGHSKDNIVYKAIAENNDPGSPTSCQRIGYRTGQIINDNNITSDKYAQERADFELRKHLILKTSMNIDIPINPLLSVNNLISINYNFFDLLKEKFLISSISCPLDYSGTMNISISNINNLTFLTKTKNE